MLTDRQVDAIMQRADYLKDLATQRGYHHALGHEEQVKYIDKMVEAARIQLENLLKNLR